jgi:hypothetical protein
VSSPMWSDEELLRELRAALQESAVDENVIRAAQAAFTWRTVDAELEVLGLADSRMNDRALVRDSDADGRHTLAFHGERLSVEMEIDDAGIVGQLTPPQPGQVTLVTPGGPQTTTQADEVGCFAFPPPAPGPLRLDCRVGSDRFITEWVTV